MKARYVDAHCHLQFPDYDSDREEIIEQMRDKGVAGIVVGCDRESCQKAVALAEQHEHLFASVGQHPNHTEPFDVSAIRTLLSSSKVVAVGECGLDYFRPTTLTYEVKRKQQERFKQHIALAAEFDKPLILHTRPSRGTMDAYDDLVALLREAKREHPHLRGDAHFFVGSRVHADALREFGFLVSFTAVITFARDYDDVIRQVPLEQILSETDAPYVAPAARRGKRNDPLTVIDVMREIANIRGTDSETVRKQLLVNAKSLFSVKA